MMAEILDLDPRSLSRWQARQERSEDRKRPLGRPKVISPEVRWKLRQRYVDSLHQWGPQVLAHWARREGLGQYSPTTIAAVIADLKPEKPPRPKTLRYEVTSPGVMWSEDGAGFKTHGLKRELLLVQDECSRLKVAHDLCQGPARGTDVRRLLKEAFDKHGAPLVLKRDGGSIFHEQSVRELLDDYGVIPLTSPPATPWYNGRAERSFRDIRSHDRAQREHGVVGSLDERIEAAIDDLNEHRPRPVLGGHTSREVHESTRVWLPDRARLRQEIEQRKQELEEAAASRHERDSASRRAIEDVLSWYGLITWKGDVSADYRREIVTN
jgi:transposase InsO family protein